MKRLNLDENEYAREEYMIHLIMNAKDNWLNAKGYGLNAKRLRLNLNEIEHVREEYMIHLIMNAIEDWLNAKRLRLNLNEIEHARRDCDALDRPSNAGTTSGYPHHRFTGTSVAWWRCGTCHTMINPALTLTKCYRCGHQGPCPCCMLIR